jgi:hypothetical protein
MTTTKLDRDEKILLAEILIAHDLLIEALPQLLDRLVDGGLERMVRGAINTDLLDKLGAMGTSGRRQLITSICAIRSRNDDNFTRDLEAIDL